MKYIIAGTGSMPKKEITEVILDLKDVRRSSVVYVASPEARVSIIEEVVRAEEFKKVYVAVTPKMEVNDLPKFVRDEARDIFEWDQTQELGDEDPEDIHLLVLIPGEDDPADDDFDLESLVEAAQELGIKVSAMNQQMYEVKAERDDAKDPEPEPETPRRRSLKAEPDPQSVKDDDDEPRRSSRDEDANDSGDAEKPEIPSVEILQGMTRDELKALARTPALGLEDKVSDWRSQQAILEALLEASGQSLPEAQEPDLTSLAAQVETLTDEHAGPGAEGRGPVASEETATDVSVSPTTGPVLAMLTEDERAQLLQGIGEAYISVAERIRQAF